MELIYELFTAPSLGMRRVRELDLPLSAGMVAVLAILSNRLGQFIFFGSPGKAKLTFSLSLAIDLIIVFGALFLLTAIFHLVTEAIGEHGRGISLYIASCLALIPFWLVTPLALIFKEQEGGTALFILAWLIMLGWTGGLFLIGLRETYQLSWRKAAAIFCLPLAGGSIALTALLFLLLAISFLGLAGMLAFYL